MKVEFWTELAAKKLDTYRLNDDAQVRFVLALGCTRALVYWYWFVCTAVSAQALQRRGVAWSQFVRTVT